MRDKGRRRMVMGSFGTGGAYSSLLLGNGNGGATDVVVARAFGEWILPRRRCRLQWEL